MSSTAAFLDQLYKPSLALLTDLYQLTMAYGYWKSGARRREAVFHLSFRAQPFGGGFTVACGITRLVEYFPDPYEPPANRAHLVERVE